MSVRTANTNDFQGACEATKKGKKKKNSVVLKDKIAKKSRRLRKSK